MSYTLQICTVGGAPEPIVASILAHRPERVLFVVSPETKSVVAERIVPDVESHQNSFPLSPSKYDFIILPNAQDFEQCVRELRNAHARYVEPWLGRGTDYQVIVDFTGGTKCMTSALALVARRWNCQFSYVGGTERTKDGVGIVVSGKEQIIHATNPWDTFGYEAVEQALLLFNNGELGGACRVLNDAKRRGSEQIKRGLSTLQQLCEGYECWDRFQHDTACSKLLSVQKSPGDLYDWFPNTNSNLLSTIKLAQTSTL
jgi:CRISPR-associated protein (TIGR02710 family)